MLWEVDDGPTCNLIVGAEERWIWKGGGQGSGRRRWRIRGRISGGCFHIPIIQRAIIVGRMEELLGAILCWRAEE